MKKIIAIMIAVCTLFLLTAPVVHAENDNIKIPMNAEICTVYGDRKGIISMTFDDGHYQSALLLQELFELYDLCGSLMMTGTSIGNAKRLAEWNALFDKGRLEPQNHSATHMNLSSDAGAENQNADTFKSEISDSKTKLEESFPEYDILTYAVPYGGMSDAAMEYAKQYYYAIRYTTPQVQSLDPDFSDNVGSWYKMHSPPTMYNHLRDNPEAQWQSIQRHIDAAAEGWYAPITHRVGDVEDTDLPLEVAHMMFSYISELNKDGKVWVTTYSNAVRYVRERQNSTVSAWEQNGEMFVRVSMSERTQDGKDLPLDVFNHPLTVKVEVPSNYEIFNYTTGGVEYTASSFIEGGKRYAYINVIPDSTDVKLRLNSSHTFGDWEMYNEENHQRTCTDCGLVAYGEHTFNKGEVTKPSTHFKEGERTCICIDCGEDTVVPEPTNNEHVFNRTSINPKYTAESANCMHATLYFHACGCGEAGTTTFEHGEKLDHDFGEWQTTLEPTATTEGEKARSCKFGCGTTETEKLPKLTDTGTNTQEKSDQFPLVPIIIGGSAVLLGISAVSVVMIIKKKKK